MSSFEPCLMTVLPKTIVADIIEYCTGMDSKTLYNLRPEWQVELWLLAPEKRELRRKIAQKQRKRASVVRERVSLEPEGEALIAAIQNRTPAMWANGESRRLIKKMNDWGEADQALLLVQESLTDRIDKLETKWRAVPENPVEHVKGLFGDE